VFKPPLPLVVPPNTSFNAYVINTNGLNPTKCAPLRTGTNHVKLNKLKMLRDLANKKKLNAIHIAEIHDQNPVALGPLKEWHSTPSTLVGGRHGTAMLMANALESVKAESNVAAFCINWEGQHIWLISAYFPNSLEETKVTIKSLKAILSTLKTKRVILARDFNSTETLSSFDTKGPLFSSEAKDKNTKAIQEVLNDW
jgi:hypothetical protein